MKELQWLEKGQEWLVTNGADFLVDLIAFLLILFVGSLVIKALLKMTRLFLHTAPRVNETLEKFIVNVTGKILWIVLLMIALPRLGVDIAPLIAGLGVSGFILGFAFKDALGNLASGLMIILNQPFKVDDFIQTAGHSGVVREINMMAVTLSTPDNKRVVLPNSAVWGGSIVNFSAFDTRRVDMTVGIAYSADIGKARDIIADILKNHKLVLADPEPQIELVEMADSSVNLVVRPWCKTPDYWTVFFDVNRGIKESFDAQGVEIPFPQMDVHMINPAAAKA